MPSTKMMIRRGESGPAYAPAGFRRLEYVQTAGIARLYTETRITNNDIRTVIYGQCTGYGSDSSYYRGIAAIATGYTGLRCGFIKNYQSAFGLEGAYSYPPGSRMLQPFKIILDWTTTGMSFTIDGVYHNVTRTNPFTGTSGPSIPSGTNDSEKQTGAPMKIFRIDQFKASELIQRFIPMIRLSDNVAGMYDVVNNIFKTSGTAAEQFTAGPVI